MEPSPLGNLSDLILKGQYRHDFHDFGHDFYDKCLNKSNLFTRAVGFYSSDSLAICPRAYYNFFSNGGLIRIVSSHIITKSDSIRFIDGYTNRSDLLKENRLHLLLGTSNEVRARLDKLVPWLVAKGLLTLQIAIINNGGTRYLYHEKLGGFSSSDEESIAFSGSANETFHALRHHFEVIDVYCSWLPADMRRAQLKKENFAALWSNKTNGLRVVPYLEARKQGLLHIRTTQPDLTNPDNMLMEDVKEDSSYGVDDIRKLDEIPYLPPSLVLYPHQKLAIRSWLLAGARGVFEMATGSGKTITALAAATKLFELNGHPLAIIVLCPYIHLVDQWAEEAAAFGFEPITCIQGRNNWEADFHGRLYAIKTEKRKIMSLVVSNSTFRTDTFQQLLKAVSVPILLIGDEMHNLGSAGLRTILPKHAPYRLGLSATPERRYDEEGSGIISDYFGLTVAKYSLREALQDGVLTKYKYLPHLITLTEEELTEYNFLTKKIARAFGNGEMGASSPGLELLLIQRARLIATAENKLVVLRSLMETRRLSSHNLIYCGDGQVEVPDSSEQERQIRAVTRILGSDLGMDVATYTAETPLDRRRQLRTDFANGDIQALIAIRCLDEGVDIPETRCAFILASVTDPRQYVQRRGRVLRRAPGKDFAEIHDFLVCPPEDHQTTESPFFEATRRLFGREMERVIEFAELAENGPEAMGTLLAIREKLQLLSFTGQSSSET